MLCARGVAKRQSPASVERLVDGFKTAFGGRGREKRSGHEPGRQHAEW
jgi:hypothetical protein